MTRETTVKRFSVVLALASLLAVLLPLGAVTAQEAPANPFGVMLQGSRPQDVSLATNLGAEVIRKRAFVDTWNGSCGPCVPYQQAGFGIILTVRATSAQPTVPVTDMAAYKTRLGAILDSVQPEVLSVENEQDANNFYDGTPAQYHAQLAAACEVAHQRGILCTDGGITSHRVVYMTYQHYLDDGEPEKAQSFARRVAYNDLDYRRLTAPGNAARTKAAAAEGVAFVEGLGAAGADYVNFHWYRHDAGAFEEAVSYLESLAGLPAISNEIGQHTTDPGVIGGMMEQTLALGLDYAIWFSIDYVVRYPEPMVIWALQSPEGGLRPHGVEYRRIASAL
jgi:hypothetical protein